MPVKKFRSIEEMKEVWYAPGDPALERTIARLWRLGQQTLQPHFPPGVHKHRSIEEMNQLQEAWEQANFDSYHRRRAAEQALLGSLK